MADLRENDEAQWLLLSGFTISAILVIFIILVNSATIVGYHSSSNALEFPKDNIRELVSESRLVATQSMDIAYQMNQTSNKSIEETTSDLIDSFSEQTSVIYAAHGQTVDINMANITINSSGPLPVGDNVWLNISYNDGNTYYLSNPEVVEVNR